MKNNVVIDETMVPCSQCGRKWHAICTLEINNPENPFLCHCCRNSSLNLVRKKKYSAKMIASTDLSEYIEKNVNLMLQEKVDSQCKVIIRVLADINMEVKIKPEIAKFFKNTIDKLPYRSKTIYAFQEINGHDVVFFALYTQEYLENCPPPNTRRVYVSYLDSVNYFQPKELRTDVYHEILLNYFGYCKKQGFLTAHIWACPPNTGDDYVFYQHPSHQRMPSKPRLIQWYKLMLEKGRKRKILSDYTNIYKFFIDSGITDPVDIPYFEGDFWPNAILEMLDAEVGANKIKQEEVVVKDFSKKKKKKSSKSMSTRLRDISKRFCEEFLVINFNAKGEELVEMNESTRTCNLKNSALVEVRDSFIYFCRENDLEFSSLRKAKYTTLRILSEIFKENQKQSRSCDICFEPDIRDRYTCNTCIDFDLCRACFEKHGHVHVMERILENQRIIRLSDMLKLLDHSIKCNKGCRSTNCALMKHLLLHAQCCLLPYEDCSMCYRYTFLIVNHAHYCRKSNNCPIIFCREKRIEEKRKEARIALKRNFNEILRYKEARKAQPVLADDNDKNDELELENKLKRKIKEIKDSVSDSVERKKRLTSFLEENPQYISAYEKKISSKLQTEPRVQCIQLGSKKSQLETSRKRKSTEMLRNDPIITKPQNVEKKLNGYFVRSPNKYNNGVTNVTQVNSHVSTDSKPIPKNHVPSLMCYQTHRPAQLVHTANIVPIISQYVIKSDGTKKQVRVTNHNTDFTDK